MATEETRFTGPTSRRGPGRAWSRYPPFKGSAVLLRGCCAPAVREWVAQCHGADPGFTAQCRIVAGMASPGGLAKQRRDMIPRHVRGAVVRGFVSDWGTYGCQSIKFPSRGSRYRGGEPVGASSEAETRLRGRPALEQGGPHPRGRLALERGRTSPEGAASPRARRGFFSAALCPSSEAEFRSRAARPSALVGRWGHQGRGPVPLGRDHFERVLGL
jgi:hypothetical protein